MTTCGDASIDPKRLERVWRCFDDKGRLQRWPNKRSEQELALWIVWSQLPDDMRMNELEFSTLLRRWHDFNDHAVLRRDLFDMGLVRRTPTGSVYSKAHPDVPAEAEAAIAKYAGV